MLTVSGLDNALQVFRDPSRHHELGAAYLALPEWFDLSIGPDTEAYLQQQLRFWQEVTGKDAYEPLINEDTPEVADMDAIYRPAFYLTGDSKEAGLHLMAMGHIMLRSDVRAGSRVLECGAGFAQNALAFARLGAKVDTVDISPGFCKAVQSMSDHFRVDLTAHHQPFGYNPAGHPGAYDLILFYECFHHCLNFEEVIPQLRDMLQPGGRLLLAGEPIYRGLQPTMPYEWGLRLDWGTAAVMRWRGWMELGFQEDYLIGKFRRAGLSWFYYDDANAKTAQIYEFRKWLDPLPLSACAMTVAEGASWHSTEMDGRFTTAESFIELPSRDGQISLVLENRRPVERIGQVTFGGVSQHFSLLPGQTVQLRFPQRQGDNQRITLTSNAPTDGGSDARAVGVFVRSIVPE